MTVGVLEPGGFADKAKHDTFCAGELECVILSVLDQSPMGNHLTQRHGLVNASRHPIIVGSNVSVYGMWCAPWLDSANEQKSWIFTVFAVGMHWWHNTIQSHTALF